MMMGIVDLKAWVEMAGSGGTECEKRHQVTKVAGWTKTNKLSHANYGGRGTFASLGHMGILRLGAVELP